MLNAIGLQNVGVEEFIRRKLPPLGRYPRANVIVNIFGYQVAEYIAVIERLNQAEGIAAYELNVSCPTSTPAAWPSAPTQASLLTWSIKPRLPPPGR